MGLNKFGHEIRVARAKVGKTMMKMAEELGTKPSFLSAMETGRSKIPTDWVDKIDQYFKSLNSPVENIRGLADAANKNVSVEGLSLQHQLLVSGFAKSDLTQEQIQRAVEFLKNLQKEGQNGAD